MPDNATISNLHYRSTSSLAALRQGPGKRYVRIGDSLFVKMAATMFGSTETTFYVVAVYFGAINIKKTRHAVPAGLTADIAAMLFAVWTVRLLFG